MRLVSLNCNQCGAPLEVPEKVQFVTCAYCSARLSIQRSGGAVYSQALDEVEKRTEQIADDLETIKLQNELASLDRQWMLDRDRYKVKGRDGEYSVPGQTGSIMGMILAAGFGLFWTVGAASMGAPVFFPLFGIVFVIIAIVGGISNLTKADAYQQSRQSYEMRRKTLLHKIRDKRGPP
jgi:hypothetical protein